jgi:hypothetical protein
MSKKIKVLGTEIALSSQKKEDYISLTDIAGYKNPEHPADVIKNWTRSKDTIEFLGLWERINNPDFKVVEFDQFRNQAGNNSFVLSPQKWIEATNAIKKHLVPDKISRNGENLIYATEADILNLALFGMTAKEWRNNNPALDGNMRDYADVSQLVCLSNLENINALFIKEGIDKSKRLEKLNSIAI